MQLEIEACLELDHPASQPARRATKKGALYAGVVRAKAKRLEVQFVKEVEEIAAKFEIRPLTKKLEAGQSELLCEACVDTEVTGASERIAAYARRTRIAYVKKRRPLKWSLGGVAVKILNQTWEISQRRNEVAVRSARSGL